MLRLDIAKTLGPFTLNIAFEADDEVIVLFGPSGSGKSLTLQMIAGLMAPDSGSIELAGRPVFDTAAGINLKTRQRRIGYVFQNYALFPHLNVAENIGYGIHHLPRAERERRVTELLRMVRLTGMEQRRPRELSGGQQQRVALARALATEPDALLLDEPFAALDAPIRVELRREFLALRKRLGIPAIFVTHDLEEASVLADRLVAVVGGRVRQIAPAREVLGQPRDRAVAELVQARNILPGELVHQSDACHIRTAIGEWRSPHCLQLPAGPVDVVIRPEVIRIVQEGRPAERLSRDLSLTGTLTELLDYGTRTVAYVDVNGTTLEVSLSPVAAQRTALAVGLAVRLSIPPEDIHVMAAR
ncbi:MAG: hypothetical protein DCC58_10935 [Chloroflexi bacterium]|nr:MAG: hypothetical protein DCC58_10935 [Chloroflexota bacterium]